LTSHHSCEQGRGASEEIRKEQQHPEGRRKASDSPEEKFPGKNSEHKNPINGPMTPKINEPATACTKSCLIPFASLWLCKRRKAMAARGSIKKAIASAGVIISTSLLKSAAFKRRSS
jgi:hypothetical protein